MDKRLTLTCSLVLGVFCVSSSVAASLCGARAAAVEFAIDASSSMGESYARPQFVNDEKEAARLSLLMMKKRRLFGVINRQNSLTRSNLSRWRPKKLIPPKKW